MAERQRTFFDAEFSADMESKKLARRRDPETSHEAAEELVRSGRQSTQCAAILARLRQGPVSNKELSGISLKYTSRISDLRQRGHQIQCIRDGRGLTWYQL